MSPYFTIDNVKAAFETRYHWGWYTHGRQPTLAANSVQSTLKKSFDDVCDQRDYHQLGWEVEPCAVRALLSLKPWESPSEVTRFVKGNLAAVARKECLLRNLWSRGCFVRSVGNMTNEMVRQYVASQYEHHGVAPRSRLDAVALASYHHPGDAGELRRSTHALFELNAHLVFVTDWRREILDLGVAEALVSHFRQVCGKHEWILWEVNVLPDHAHIFVGFSPDDAPGNVALNLMNNSEYFLERRYAAAWRDQVTATVWQPGVFVGTAGSATTAQVKAFLARGEQAMPE